MNEALERDRVEQIAITYLKTPFHDHGEVKGAGVDCATLLKCVFTEAGIVAPFTLDHYPPQFFLHNSEERYIAWIERCGGVEIIQADARPGDVVLYRIKAAKCFCHAALIVSPGWPSIIHAHFASRRVRRGNGLQPHLGSPVVAVKFFSIFSRPSSRLAEQQAALANGALEPRRD